MLAFASSHFLAGCAVPSSTETKYKAFLLAEKNAKLHECGTSARARPPVPTDVRMASSATSCMAASASGHAMRALSV